MKDKRVKKIKNVEPYEYHVQLSTSKERRKCVERIKKLARQSMEYNDYIYFLKAYCDFDSCYFFRHLSSSNPASKAKVECHHGPLTIDDICDIVLQKWIDNGMEINELLIAEEVMELHYRNLVGLTPLSKTVHQVITNSDKIFVPIFSYYGNWQEFLNLYANYIDEKYFDKIEEAINRSKSLTEEDFAALKVQFEYLDVEGRSEVEKIEDNESNTITVA